MSTIALDHRRFDTRDHDRGVRPVRHLHAVPSVTPATAVRLTRRGKVAVVIGALVTIALLAVMFGSSTAATDQAGALQETTSVRVTPGLTLWQVATAANPNGDIRSTVDDIVRINSLPNASALQMGSEIAVPVYS